MIEKYVKLCLLKFKNKSVREPALRILIGFDSDLEE